MQGRVERRFVRPLRKNNHLLVNSADYEPEFPPAMLGFLDAAIDAPRKSALQDGNSFCVMYVFCTLVL